MTAPASPRVAFGALAVSLSYTARERRLTPDDLAPLFVAALRLLPEGARPLTCVGWFSEGTIGVESREPAAIMLRDFVQSWLAPAEKPLDHDWQKRRDCGL